MDTDFDAPNDFLREVRFYSFSGTPMYLRVTHVPTGTVMTFDGERLGFRSQFRLRKHAVETLYEKVQHTQE